MPIQIEPISMANRAIAAQLLRDYSIELEPDDYHGREDAHAAELEQWLGKLYDEAATGTRYYWLAYADGQLIGFVVFRVLNGWWDPTSKYGKLDEFYIVPTARAQGRGRELAEMAFAEMQQQGAANVELGVIMSNTSGLAFWQSLGLQLNYQVLKMPLSADATEVGD